MQEINAIVQDAYARKYKDFKGVEEKLKKMNDREADAHLHAAHERAFAKVDCLACANCCATTGPLVREADIARISKHLKMAEKAFVEKYLRRDPDDGEWMVRSLPCPFLGADGYCSIYAHRPKACREFPHTDRKKVRQILPLTMKNLKVCPAVQGMFLDLAQHWSDKMHP